MNGVTDELRITAMCQYLSLALGELEYHGDLAGVLRGERAVTSIQASGDPYYCSLNDAGTALRIYHHMFVAVGTMDRRRDITYSYMGEDETLEGDAFMIIPADLDTLTELLDQLPRLYKRAHDMAADHGLTLEDHPLRLGRIHLCYDRDSECLRGYEILCRGLVISAGQVELVDIGFSAIVDRRGVSIENVVRLGGTAE